ncbi:MAG: glycosyltransferase [Chthoniobacter sp.]|nr:glycosyltransferase [Chthoniobacter sp.]
MPDALASSAPPAASPAPLPQICVRAKFFFEGDRKWFIKGVTYGPFAPDAAGDFVGDPVKARRDFALMQEMGINLLRIYHVPPKWFLDLAREFRLRVLISIPWAEHVEFLNNAKIRRQVEETIRAGVAKNAGHEAIFGYYVGNEIPFAIVRWLGAQRVIEFVEKLIRIARAADPRALFSYASYPPTEYLLPTNVDFVSYNVYLERQRDFEKYLARLQNLAEDKPLIFGEFGMDTIRKGEDEQASVLSWHLESVVRGGAAGTIFFAWTDEWFTGGHDITDWAFGLVTRDRQPKKAFAALQKYLRGDSSMTQRVALPSYPKVSVIVCSYNGGKTLAHCLESLDEVTYPDFEIVLVDDGSKDDSQALVRAWLEARRARVPTIRQEEGAVVNGQHHEARCEVFDGGGTLPGFIHIVQPNMGLSYARNAGAHAARGEIFAYTDSDCMADPDWLYFMVGTLLSGDFVGVGGPNISPPAVNWVQAAVSAAPGGPSHVLLTDVVAEHIPGCNMAFHRAAFASVGGFDTEYRKAGDDVDFCWRLQTNGGVIAFSPSAIVWHYRRFTLNAFRKQQEGYGEAESMLRFKHLIFFGPTGTAKWKGQIYGAPRFTWLFNKPVIYHGVFGQGLFQSIYPTPQSEVSAYLSSVEWVVLTAFIAVLGWPLEKIRMVPLLMLLGTFLVALSYMIHARIEPKFDTIPARLLVAFLAFMQPLGRGWARYFTWMTYKKTPGAVIAKPEPGVPAASHRGGCTKIDLWNETGKGREQLLSEIFQLLEDEGWRYSADTGWKDWDLQIYGNKFWSITVRTVTEYHGGPKCLTRVRLRATPVAATILVNAVLLAGLLYRAAFTRQDDYVWWALYMGMLVWLYLRAWRLKRRVADLVIAAALRCELVRVFGAASKPAPKA